MSPRQLRAKPIRMMPVSCGQNAVLGSFHFEFSEGGKWGRVRNSPELRDFKGRMPGLCWGVHELGVLLEARDGPKLLLRSVVRNTASAQCRRKAPSRITSVAVRDFQQANALHPFTIPKPRAQHSSALNARCYGPAPQLRGS